jgi:hypothetical protein
MRYLLPISGFYEKPGSLLFSMVSRVGIEPTTYWPIGRISAFFACLLLATPASHHLVSDKK